MSRAARDAVAAHVRRLLAWQRDLADWPGPARAPDATPFVSVYAGGVLRGCFGCGEGAGGERLTRAFLRALEDSRYGMVRPDERTRLDVAVSYVRELRVVDADRVTEELEPGHDGLAIAWDDRPAVLLLPGVARDRRAGAAELLAMLLRKAGVQDAGRATLFALRTEDVVVRSSDPGRPAPSPAGRRSPEPGRAPRSSPRRLGVRWLEGLVGAGGEVTFAIDPRKRARWPSGVMHHGRAAVVVRALERHGARSAAARARAWIERSLATALGGGVVAAWPEDPAMVAGTLALARLAGADVEAPLLEMASRPALQRVPWHAAQVVAALGPAAPADLWRACVADLDVRPWAPWTLLAARARGDAAIVSRAVGPVVDSIRTGAPHAGGCSQTAVPEIALTALAVEALEGLPEPACRVAVARARAFLGAWQLLPGAVPASIDPALATGAFPASPVAVDSLRCDITAHALLALPPGAEGPSRQPKASRRAPRGS